MGTVPTLLVQTFVTYFDMHRLWLPSMRALPWFQTMTRRWPCILAFNKSNSIYLWREKKDSSTGRLGVDTTTLKGLDTHEGVSHISYFSCIYKVRHDTRSNHLDVWGVKSASWLQHTHIYIYSLLPFIAFDNA